MTLRLTAPVAWTPILYDVAHAFESVEGAEARIDRVFALMRRFVPYERCALLEADPVLGRRISIMPEVSARERDELAERLSTLLELVSEHPFEEMQRASVPRGSGHAHLAVPIIALGETSGVVFVERARGSFDESHLAFLSVIAAQIGAYLAAVRADRDLRASEGRFRRVYESGMIGIAFMHEDGTITESNAEFAAILGRSQAEVRRGAVSWCGATPPEQRERDRAALREAAERGTCAPYETIFLHADGHPVTALAGAARLETPDSLVAFVLDISDHKRIETERAELLERRESDLEFLEMFMGMLGHDLRNPLNAIRMSAELLQLTEGARLPDRTDLILASTDRMERMVDQLLDLTRIRLAGGMLVEPARVDLADVCRRVIDELNAAHPDESILLEVTGDVAGEWDGDRLFQVVSNLLANAIQHARGAARSVTVSVTGTERTVELRTHNPGAIPAELRSVLFDPFRGAKPEGRRKGLGLGLFISKHIVEAHGGSIEFDSSEPGGTTFVVTLPRRRTRKTAG